MLINGSCHCGNISFVLDWRPTPAQIPARACGCSFCVKHGGVWTSCPEGTLRVHIKTASRTSRHVFGTKTAQFHVCCDCGVVPVVTSLIDGRLYAVVNVNTFDHVDPARLDRRPAAFADESADDRLARRARAWIAHVDFLQ